MYIFEHFAGTIPALQRLQAGEVTNRGNTVPQREYVARQITTLMRFAKTTTDPNVSAALIEKAANTKDQHDPPPQWSPHAPDVEPTTSNFYDPAEDARPEIAS